MRKRLDDMDLLGSLFLLLAFLAPSLLGRPFSRSATWSSCLLWNSVSGFFDGRSDPEESSIIRPPCAVHSVLLDKRLIVDESGGSRSLYMSFLRGFRDAICSLVLLFLGSELDAASTSEIISTDSADVSFQLARLFCGEPVAAIIAGLGWVSSPPGGAAPTFRRGFSSPRSLCFRVCLTRLSARGFAADTVSRAMGAATAYNR